MWMHLQWCEQVHAMFLIRPTISDLKKQAEKIKRTTPSSSTSLSSWDGQKESGWRTLLNPWTQHNNSRIILNRSTGEKVTVCQNCDVMKLHTHTGKTNWSLWSHSMAYGISKNCSNCINCTAYLKDKLRHRVKALWHEYICRSRGKALSILNPQAECCCYSLGRTQPVWMWWQRKKKSLPW